MSKVRPRPPRPWRPHHVLIGFYCVPTTLYQVLTASTQFLEDVVGTWLVWRGFKGKGQKGGRGNSWGRPCIVLSYLIFYGLLSKVNLDGWIDGWIMKCRTLLPGHFPIRTYSPPDISPARQFPSPPRTFRPTVKAKIWKLALTNTLGPNPPTTRVSNSNRPTGRGIIWKLALTRIRYQFCTRQRYRSLYIVDWRTVMVEWEEKCPKPHKRRGLCGRGMSGESMSRGKCPDPGYCDAPKRWRLLTAGNVIVKLCRSQVRHDYDTTTIRSTTLVRHS